LFIWCSHPAEIGKDTLLSKMITVKPENILFYGLTKEIYFNGVDTTEDVIKHAKNGISTVSSCLLDYEINKIPLALYETSGLLDIIESIDIGSTFKNIDALQSNNFTMVKTNKLYPYNVKLFDANLEGFKSASIMYIKSFVRGFDV